MASSPSNPSPSPSDPPQTPQQQRRREWPTDQYNNTNPLVHYIALGTTPLALLGLCLPPRRLDTRALMLGGVALWGTNQLAHDYGGKSFGERFSSRFAFLDPTALPEKAKETQTRLREEKERLAKLRALRDEMVRSGVVEAKGPGLEGWTDEQKKTLIAAYEKQRREEEATKAPAKEDAGILNKIWMGDADPDWKEKRDQREKEALKEGGVGYWGLITDQISEVWNGKKADAPKEKTDEDAKTR